MTRRYRGAADGREQRGRRAGFTAAALLTTMVLWGGLTPAQAQNQAPVLQYTGQPGYESDGVNPDSGTLATSFEFRAMYTDGDGQSPIAVQLHVLNNGAPVTGSPFTMAAQPGGDATTGIIYTGTVSGLARGTKYTYYCSSTDGIDQAVGPLASQNSGPVVLNTSPVASGISLSPDPALSTDNLKVTYSFSDADGDAEQGSSVVWTVNGTAVGDLDDPAVLPAGFTKMRDLVGVSVQPSDGYGFGVTITAERLIQYREVALSSLGTQGVTGRDLPVTATLTGEGGVAIANELVTFSSTEAEIPNKQVLTNSMGQAMTNVRPRSGQNVIRATSGGAAASLTLQGRAPRSATVTVLDLNANDQLSVVADVPALVRVQVVDVATSVPVAGIAVTSELVTGQVSPTNGVGITDVRGEAQLLLTFGLGDSDVKFISGDRATTVTAVAVAGAISPATSTVAFNSAAATVPGDGQSSIVLIVTLKDANGNPVGPVASSRFKLTGEPDLDLTLGLASAGADGVARHTIKGSTPGETILSVRVRDPLTNQLVLLTDSLRLRVDHYTVLQLRPGLNLVGSPVTLADPSALSVWSDVTPVRVARYLPDSNDYRALSVVNPSSAFDVVPGRAFWVRAGTDVNVALSGAAYDSRTYRVDLSSGDWTLASLPSVQAIAWDSGLIQVTVNDIAVGSLANTSGFVAPYAWVWNAALQQHVLVIDAALGIHGSTSAIPVGSGFWIRRGASATGSGRVGLEFDFDSLGRSTGSSAVAPGAGGWVLSLQAQNEQGTASASVGVATRLSRSVGLEAPPAPEASLLTLEVLDPDSGRAVQGHLSSRAVGTGGLTWRLRIAADPTGGPVTLSWPSANRQLPRGFRAVLTDPSTNRSVALGSRAALAVEPGTRELLLTVERASAERLAISLQAQATRARGAGLTVTLTQPATVRVRVRGLNGRLVKEWSEGLLEVGTHALAWDGTDAAGRRVPSGTYRLEAWAEDDLGELATATSVIAAR